MWRSPWRSRRSHTASIPAARAVAPGGRVTGIETTATRDGDGWILCGEKIFITNSLNADVFFIAAKTAPDAGHRGLSMFLLERETSGFRIDIHRGKPFIEHAVFRADD